MNHQHKPGCRCAECLGSFDQRENAAQQLYQLLNLGWVGMRAATAYADFAKWNRRSVSATRASIAQFAATTQPRSAQQPARRHS